MRNFIIFMTVLFNTTIISAQFLTVDTQVKIGTGIAITPGYNEVNNRRSFTNIIADISFIVDEDRSFQYGFSIDLDLETRMTFTPGFYFKLEKKLNNTNFSIFTVGGITYMVTPETIFGFRVGFGSNYMLLHYLGFVLQLDIEPLLFGSGLDGKMMNEIKVLFGVNVLF